MNMRERQKAKSLTAAPSSSKDPRTGQVKSGDRLPPERELIEIVSISRPSLREALRSLSILSVIEARHGGGAFVTNLDAKTLLSPLDFTGGCSGRKGHRRQRTA